MVTLNVEEMAEWISAQSGIDVDVVLTVLDLEEDYMSDLDLIDEMDEDE